jgi:hypothetical protein
MIAIEKSYAVVRRVSLSVLPLLRQKTNSSDLFCANIHHDPEIAIFAKAKRLICGWKMVFFCRLLPKYSIF